LPKTQQNRQPLPRGKGFFVGATLDRIVEEAAPSTESAAARRIGSIVQQWEDSMKGKYLAMMLGLMALCPVMSDAAQGDGARYTLSITKDYTPSLWTTETGYMSRMGHKLAFGGKNALLGWMELYTEPRESMEEQEGFFRGMGHGVVNMLGDTIGGVMHVATFPITAVDMPLPEGGVL